jgi:hypothetical protein
MAIQLSLEVRLERSHGDSSQLRAVDPIARRTTTQRSARRRETMSERGHQWIETLDQTHIHYGTPWQSQQSEHSGKRTFRGHHIGRERAWHAVAEETGLRLVREVVPGLLGIAHRPHDAKHTQSRKSRTEGVRIEAETGQGRRTLTGEEQVRRAKEHSETSLSFRGLEV